MAAACLANGEFKKHKGELLKKHFGGFRSLIKEYIHHIWHNAVVFKTYKFTLSVSKTVHLFPLKSESYKRKKMGKGYILYSNLIYESHH